MTARTKKKQGEPTIVKKYANRRLYDTGRSSYVTLSDLYEMVKEGHDFVVYDAKSGEDLTRSVLTQIIVEKEASGEDNMLPTGFLKQLIGFYDENMQALVPGYLEHSLKHFHEKQEEFGTYFEKSLEGMFAVDALEEVSRRNMQLFEQTMSMFSPFHDPAQTGSTDRKQRAQEIRNTIRELEKELEELSEK